MHMPFSTVWCRLFHYGAYGVLYIGVVEGEAGGEYLIGAGGTAFQHFHAYLAQQHLEQC